MVIWRYNSATASTVAIWFSVNTKDIYNKCFTKYEYRYQKLYGTVSSLNKLWQGYGTLYSVIMITSDNLQYLRLNKQCNTVRYCGLSTAVQLVQTNYFIQCNSRIRCNENKLSQQHCLLTYGRPHANVCIQLNMVNHEYS